MDLVQQTARFMPVDPTSSDTADWYRLGDATEKHGRHMKRQAVAAEYNSGRNMEDWYREIGLPSGSGRELLGEARSCELLSDMSDSSVSQALPTARAAREYAKAEPEIREVIKEIIKEDPEAEIKAAEIKRLNKALLDSNKAVLDANTAFKTSDAMVGKLTEALTSQKTEVEKAKSQKEKIARAVPSRMNEVYQLVDLYKDALSDDAKQSLINQLNSTIALLK